VETEKAHSNCTGNPDEKAAALMAKKY